MDSELIMNERVRELVKRAGGHFSTRNLMSNPVQHKESVELWDDRIEKLVELVVWDSVQMFADNGYDESCDMLIEHWDIDPRTFRS